MVDDGAKDPFVIIRKVSDRKGAMLDRRLLEYGIQSVRMPSDQAAERSYVNGGIFCS